MLIYRNQLGKGVIID